IGFIRPLDAIGLQIALPVAEMREVLSLREFFLAASQLAVLGLDLIQHLVERIRQNPSLIVARFGSANRIIIVISNRARSFGEAKNRISYQTEKLARENERDQKGCEQNQRKNAAVEFEQLRGRAAQVRQQRKSSLLVCAKHYRLRENDSITINSKTGFQSCRLDFGFVARCSKKCQALPII